MTKCAGVTEAGKGCLATSAAPCQLAPASRDTAHTGFACLGTGTSRMAISNSSGAMWPGSCKQDSSRHTHTHTPLPETVKVTWTHSSAAMTCRRAPASRETADINDAGTNPVRYRPEIGKSGLATSANSVTCRRAPASRTAADNSEAGPSIHLVCLTLGMAVSHISQQLNHAGKRGDSKHQLIKHTHTHTHTSLNLPELQQNSGCMHVQQCRMQCRANLHQALGLCCSQGTAARPRAWCNIALHCILHCCSPLA